MTFDEYRNITGLAGRGFNLYINGGKELLSLNIIDEDEAFIVDNITVQSRRILQYLFDICIELR